MSLDLSYRESEAPGSPASAAETPVAFGSSLGCQLACPRCVMDEGKTKQQFSHGWAGGWCGGLAAPCSGGVKLGAWGSGKEMSSLLPIVRGLKCD